MHCGLISRSGWEKVYRFRRRNGLDIPGFKLKQLDSLHQPTFKFFIAELTRYDFAECDLASRRNGQPEDQLALESWVNAQCPVIERKDRALVLIKDEFDFFAAARGLAAGAGTSGTAGRLSNRFNRALYCCEISSGQG